MPPAFALSQDQTLRFISIGPVRGRSERTRSRLSVWVPSVPSGTDNLTSVSVTHKRYTSADTPIQNLNPDDRTKSQNRFHHPKPKPDLTSRSRAKQRRTPPTYPFLAYANVKDHRTGARPRRPNQPVRRGRRLLGPPIPCVNAITLHRPSFLSLA